MHCVFRIQARHGARIQSRVLQVFDAQVITLESFTSIRVKEKISMKICADVGSCEGGRLKALLLRLPNVCWVEVRDAQVPLR